MAADETAAETKGVGDRFPALKPLEEDVERAKLDQALAEARTKTITAKLPSLDVELTRDTVTAADKTTGLARVLVQMCSSVLADDVAGLALDAARESTGPDSQQKRCYRIRIVDDSAVFRDVDVARILDGHLTNLGTRIDDYAPAGETTVQGDEPEGEPGEVGDEVLPAALLLAGPIIGLGLQAAGLASKLLAHDYQTSGAEVAVDDLGFDLLLARRLVDQRKPDEELYVEVDRILPTPEPRILNAVWQLALRAQQQLAPVVAAAAGARAEAQAALDAAETAVTALDAQILELVKRLPEKPGSQQPGDLPSRLAELRDQRGTLAVTLPALATSLADAREHHQRGSDLLADIEDFLVYALTPGASGARAPVAQAARVDSLRSSDPEGQATHFLFARLIAGGVDHTTETKVGRDRWFAISASTVEYALLAAGGGLCTTGVRSVFQTSDMKLGDADSLEQERPDYVAIERNEGE
jgi:hypothetical protein